MMYKKPTALDDALLEQIKQQQKEVIMERIMHLEHTPRFTFSLRHKWVWALNLGIVIIIALLVTILNVGSDPTEAPYAYEDVYADLISFQARFQELSSEHEMAEESNVYTMSHVNPDYVRTYEELRESYTNNVIPEGDFIQREYLLIASDYYDVVIDVVNMYDYIPLFKWVDGVDSETIDRFKIMIHDNNHYTLATMKAYDDYEEYNVFYLGLNNDIFEVEHIRYFGDINITGSDTNFNFFRLEEDKEAVYITVNDDSTSISHTSFDTGNQFMLLKNYEEMEKSTNEDVYYVSYKEDDIYRSILFSDTTLYEESYWIYNDLGLVFSYRDNDVQDDTVSLQFNLLEAPGWDYASYNPHNKEEQGVYKDNVKMFNEHSVSVSKQYLDVAVDLYMSVEKTHINNDLLDLSMYGLDFYQGNITVEFLNTLRVQDINELKNDITFNDHDFEALTNRESLYANLRSILKNSIMVVSEDEK